MEGKDYLIISLILSVRIIYIYKTYFVFFCFVFREKMKFTLLRLT